MIIAIAKKTKLLVTQWNNNNWTDGGVLWQKTKLQLDCLKAALAKKGLLFFLPYLIRWSRAERRTV